MRVLLSIVLCCLAGAAAAGHDTWEEQLPDDYLPFVLEQVDGRLEGASRFLEGFTISMDVAPDDLTVAALFDLVRAGGVVGVQTFPNGKTKPIAYEIVHHRGAEDIYMKSPLGYFLWEYMQVENGKLYLAIYWWYHPPAETVDLEILDLAAELLSDPDDWHQQDDRDCDDDIEHGVWSLFCALQHASLTVAGEYNHHNTAIQTTRFVIDDLVPDHEFAHTLMDYNNAPETSFEDIRSVLESARVRVAEQMVAGGD